LKLSGAGGEHVKAARRATAPVELIRRHRFTVPASIIAVMIASREQGMHRAVGHRFR
jgi:hypothetical protein